ncbi:tetratricopeptide repeat protein [Spirosoma aerophilum]
MLELTALTVFIGYIVYLRYYADQRSKAEIEAERLRDGIDLYETDQYAKALNYFGDALKTRPTSTVALLYRARIYRALGDAQAALADLTRAKSFDDSLADLHLESGQIHFEAKEYTTAFQDFDKAIFHAHGDAAEPYRWRGLTRQYLQQATEAEQDLAKAKQLEQQQRIKASSVLPVGKPRFFDRQFFQNAGLTIISALILLYIIKKSSVIHWPYLWAAASAVGIGFLEPRKGWVLALLRVFVILFGYYVVVGPDPLSTHREVEVFSLYGSVGLTFAGSLIGSVLRKAYAG